MREESNTGYIFYLCNIAEVFNGFSEIDIGIRDFLPGQRYDVSIFATSTLEKSISRAQLRRVNKDGK